VCQPRVLILWRKEGLLWASWGRKDKTPKEAKMAVVLRNKGRKRSGYTM
jgi:hypothetical protein